MSVVGVDEHDCKATMGYCVAKKYWSQGYMTEAARAAPEYMLNEVGLNRVEASHSVNNPASGRVFQKIGMKKEGFARQYYKSALGFQDSDLYGITKDEFK